MYNVHENETNKKKKKNRKIDVESAPVPPCFFAVLELLLNPLLKNHSQRRDRKTKTTEGCLNGMTERLGEIPYEPTTYYQPAPSQPDAPELQDSRIQPCGDKHQKIALSNNKTNFNIDSQIKLWYLL